MNKFLLFKENVSVNSPTLFSAINLRMEKSSFSWKWKNLTHVRPEFYETNTFVVSGYQWIIKYRKNETSIGGKESISILLELLSAGDVSLLFGLYVNAINGERVALVSDNHKKFLKREVVTTLSETSSEEILWNKVSSFVDNDTLKLECEVSFWFSKNNNF
jgi:hypothetical protein